MLRRAGAGSAKNLCFVSVFPIKNGVAFRFFTIKIGAAFRFFPIKICAGFGLFTDGAGERFSLSVSWRRGKCFSP